MKKHFTTIGLVVIFMIGLSLLLYPTVSDYWNSFHQSHAVASYDEKIAGMDNAVYREFLDNAAAYNAELAQQGNHWMMTEEELEDYNAQLNVTGTGMMGYIEISRIDCKLPIYHGTDSKVLQKAIGHIEGSSLPVGGESSHCLLSGHRGLPSAKLFTRLDQLTEGDTFVLHILDETLTYEVDQIRIVLPDELDELEIVEGEDFCTLITCTPYGVNTHRLLVRGRRVPNDTSVRVPMDAVQIEPFYVAPIVAIPILLLLLVWLFVSTRKKKSKR